MRRRCQPGRQYLESGVSDMPISPIDYTLNVRDPADRILQGYKFGLDAQQAQQDRQIQAAQEARAAGLYPLQVQGAQQGLDIAAAREARAADLHPYAVAQAQEQAQAQERRNAFYSGMADLAAKGPNVQLSDVADLSMKYPEYGNLARESYDAMDEGRKATVRTILGQFAYALKNGNEVAAKEFLSKYVEAARNSGDAEMAATADGMLKVMDISPDLALGMAGLTLHEIDPGMAAEIFPDTASLKVHQSIPIGDGSVVKLIMSDGSIQVMDSNTGETLTGEAAAQAVADANAAEIAQERAKFGSRTAGALEAKAEGAGGAEAARAGGALQIKFVENANDGAAKILTSISNIDRAINAIDSGAKSGVIAKYLPDVTAESAALSNALNAMGLDVVGSVTFGALSEKELKTAMEVAAPRNLSPENLRAWLVARRDAQNKLRAALIEQAAYLADPNHRLTDWYDLVNSRSGAQGDGSDLPSYLRTGQ